MLSMLRETGFMKTLQQLRVKREELKVMDDFLLTQNNQQNKRS